MSNETKYQVFISSTYTDLIEARSAAINTVLESYNFPVGMELFGADNDEQWTIIRELIDSSDFYILILGHRYGSISQQDGISFTEKEFDYAISKGLKILCFVRNNNVATHPHERDVNNENVDKLQQFRQKVLTDRLCEFWDTVDDLKHKISNSLYKNIRKHKGGGWVRGNQVSGQLAEEIAKLSEENRKLREENERLKRSDEIRKPNLITMINGIDGSNNPEVINLKIRELVGSERFVKPESLQESNFDSPWVDVETLNKQQRIRDFNAKLSKITDADVVVINQKIQELYQLDQGLTDFIIQIKNNGSSLAKNIDIEIELPAIVRLIDDLTTRNVRKLKRDAANQIVYLPYPDGHNVPDFHDIDVPRPTMPSSNVTRPNTFIKGNMLNITLDSLLHSKSKEFFKFYLCPLEKGEGLIKIKIICEEYLEAVYAEIPIIIE